MGFFQPHLFFDNSTTILNTLNKNTYRKLSLFLINFTPKLNVFLQNIYPRQKYSVFLIISSILFKYAYLEYLIYNYKRFFFSILHISRYFCGIDPFDPFEEK